MKKACCSATALLLLFGGSIRPSWSADKTAVLQATNQAYYNLRTRGLVEFSCKVVPDWDTGMKELNPDPAAREKVLPMVQQLTFDVAIGPTGAASVSHRFERAPQSEEAAQGLKQVSDGFEQMITGFFQTWSQLMINPPLSGAVDDYQMEEKEGKYRFIADQGKIHSSILINRDFVIDSIDAKSPEFAGVVHPRFVRREGGLILDSYEADFTAGANPSQHLSVTIQYQDIEGLALPRTITMSTLLDQRRVVWPMTFDSCRIKKK